MKIRQPHHPNQFADGLNWHGLCGPQLSGIKNVEIKVMLLRFWDSLNDRLPFGWTTVQDGFVEILAMEIC